MDIVKTELERGSPEYIGGDYNKKTFHPNAKWLQTQDRQVLSQC